MTEGLRLDGVDGATPQGFLAALGVLDVVTRKSNGQIPKLWWRQSGTWVPTLSFDFTLSELADLIVRDRDDALLRPVLRFRYPKRDKNGVKPVGCLTPPVAVLRAWLEARMVHRDWLSLREMAALMSELGVDSIKPEKQFSVSQLAELGIESDVTSTPRLACLQTAFDFTSRNAQFLDQLRQIGGSLNAADVSAQLTNRSSGAHGMRTMDWAYGSDAPGALYNAKQDFQRTALDWLAWRGLTWLPVFGKGDKAQTTSCTGRRKQGVFSWCVWGPPCTLRVAASLLATGLWRLQRVQEREAAGIQAVYECQLTKAADGYGGIFSPTSFV